MRLHKQRLLHDPDNGVYGDCMRTVLACLLDMLPEDVPHFLHDNCDGVEFHRRIDDYLASQGLKMFTVLYQCSVQDVLDTISAQNPNVRYMISGQSERGINHIVVACNGEIEWDTHPSNAGICAPSSTGYVYVDVLVPRAVHLRGDRS